MVFAGGTVVIAILGLAVAGMPFMTAAGIATSVIVALMVLASVTLLPAFLGLAGPRISRSLWRRSVPGSAAAVTRWERWGRHVAARPWPYAIGVTVLLLVLTAPVLGSRLGFPDDGTAPFSTTQRRAYDLVAKGFGPGLNGPLLIAVDVAGDVPVVDRLAAAVADAEGIAAVAPPEVDVAAGVATIVALPATAPWAAARCGAREPLLGRGPATAPRPPMGTSGSPPLRGRSRTMWLCAGQAVASRGRQPGRRCR